MIDRFPLRIRRRLAGARRDDHGAAVVEFALVVPVLFLIIFAVIDFGRALWTMNVLTSGVREGARVAAVGDTTAATRTRARGATVSYIRGILGTSAMAADSTTDGTVTVAYAPATGLYTVTITGGFPFRPVTPLVNVFFPSTFRFNPSANYRWERAN